MSNYFSVFQKSAKFVGQSIAMNRNTARTLCSGPATSYNFETLKLTTPKPFVVHVELNRPDRLNAFNKRMWTELGECFNRLHNDPDCRSIVLSGGNSKHFTAGIDLLDMMKLGQELGEIDDIGRKARMFEGLIKLYQDSISSLERCYKPVIAAVHTACVGAGVDLITAADIRYCTRDAWFQVKEVDIGMAADVGTLQRLPKVIGSQSLARELCFTGRKFQSVEALSCGLVSNVFESREEMIAKAIQLADDIASKSPIAVQGTKKNMIYSLDHTNQEGLDQIREMNMANLQSEDFINAVMAQQSKDALPIFAKL
ncbi:delta(3,5)-Delta(2,4)-dienoyl-CoA isomerase, mitochondrial [Sabethes cyaneus]|uniref:delta(3,5)-Delta(2,4)-dienoyl-CoA isomerase, mitochondrial n=1 Tax=Sabethes cyaneus TaxID=53552 RepID=UPI00221E3784|nr:delta(3,5)-Delta(2,4)-dienoyl-CoA isomerase, mitochondrial [Sabethes cyaneus]XP_053687410.1 delta(3,5)-Delta(2,4)-dienoyl-CoA isomerase, mitochondrial [Sabethes cyaneus]